MSVKTNKGLLESPAPSLIQAYRTVTVWAYIVSLSWKALLENWQFSKGGNIGSIGKRARNKGKMTDGRWKLCKKNGPQSATERLGLRGRNIIVDIHKWLVGEDARTEISYELGRIIIGKRRIFSITLNRVCKVHSAHSKTMVTNCDCQSQSHALYNYLELICSIIQSMARSWAQLPPR